MPNPLNPVERLWKSAKFLPQTVRLLGTRYRSLFLAYAQSSQPEGEAIEVADALAFIDFMFTQERVGLLETERLALGDDQRALRRRFRLHRQGEKILVTEKWKIVQWVGL